MASPVPENRSIWTALAILAAFWTMALALALTDIDFFSLQDLFDTHDLHHGHFVAGLLLLGIVGAVLTLIRSRRRIAP